MVGLFGSVNVGNWIGGVFSNDEMGVFFYCVVMVFYVSGVIFVVG